jgi:hypothetical protein
MAMAFRNPRVKRVSVVEFAGVHLLICNAPTVNLKYSEGSFPISEMLAAEILSLPMCPGFGQATEEDCQ